MPKLTDSAIQRDRVASRGRYYKNQDVRRKQARERNARLLEERPFIGWDGEGHRVFVCDSEGTIDIRHQYMLFGCSVKEYVTGWSLSTKECLDLILYVESLHPDAFHVGFAFEYDVNMILKDLPWRMLAILYDAGSVIWNGYRIKHTPHKMFSVSRSGTTATIYDVFGFFHCSFVSALRKYRIGNADVVERINRGKDSRSAFTYAQMVMVIDYWSEEISLLPPLMECIRESAYNGGFRITEWHGPGALAAYALRQHDTKKYYSGDVPIEVRIAITMAFAGGRFQAWRCGLFTETVYTADINSAYIYACSLLPRLDNGQWFRRDPHSVTKSTVAHFGLYHLSFSVSGTLGQRAHATGNPEPPYPLFLRDTHSRITWPSRVDGWYWSPEAKLVIGSKDCEVLEAWEYHDDGTRPFTWVHDSFLVRLELQHQENPAEKAYKWALAAIYGQFARRVGWNKKTRSAPKSHELAWAGFITSYCRAMVYDAAAYAASKGGLISIDTDGITSTVPFDESLLDNGRGENLGQWKLEEWNGILFWQNGIYWLLDSEGNWIDAKCRGVPKGSISFDLAHESLQAADFDNRPVKQACITVERTRFIGYRQALNHQFDKWQRWLTDPVDIIMGGSGKGRHLPVFCRACRTGEDIMHTVCHVPPREWVSQPHKLPWLIDKPVDDNVFIEEIWEDFSYGD